jgi:hypothetical protein
MGRRGQPVWAARIDAGAGSTSAAALPLSDRTFPQTRGSNRRLAMSDPELTISTMESNPDAKDLIDLSK